MMTEGGGFCLEPERVAGRRLVVEGAGLTLRCRGRGLAGRLLHDDVLRRRLGEEVVDEAGALGGIGTALEEEEHLPQRKEGGEGEEDDVRVH